MSILIKGMGMPRKCIRCPVNVYGRCLVNDDKDVSEATANAVRDKDCPIIPVPPHGRLIDAEALEDSLLVEYTSVIYAINNAPTIIEAEPPKEET